MPSKKDRRAYWAAYHAKRQETDPAYRKRKNKATKRWQALEKAERKGDMQSWLKTFQNQT
jgi:hypothetical protein